MRGRVQFASCREERLEGNVRGQGGTAAEEVVWNCVFHMNYNRNGYKLERCVDREPARAINTAE